MNKNFEEAYTLLNKQQKLAVNTIDGPLLVIAGPGTGKTQLLSARVANILKSTDTKAQNILCLTFTNKSAVNMRSRIIELAGPDGAKVAASTFHSFAAEIMSLYPDNFWSAARLSVAPDTVQLDVIETIVSRLPLDNPLALKFAGQHTLIKSIQRSITLAKEAGLTPDKLRAIIEYNLAYIEGIEGQFTDLLTPRLTTKSLDQLVVDVNNLKEQKIDKLVFPLTSLSTVISGSLAEAVAKDKGTGKTENTGKWKARWVQTIDGKRGMFSERSRNSWWLELANIYQQYRQMLHLRGFYDYADMLVEVISQLENNPAMLADLQERFNYVLIDEFQDTTPAQMRLAHLIADHHASEGSPNLMAVGDDDQSIYKFNGAELNNMLGFKRNYPTAKIIILTDNYRSSQAILNVSQKIIEQADSRLINSDPSLNKDLKAVSSAPKKGTISAKSYASQELQLSRIARDIKSAYNPERQLAVLARGHDSLIKMAGIFQQLGVPVRYEQSSNVLDHELIKQTHMICRLLLAIQSGDKDTVDALIHQIIRWPAWGIEPGQLWETALQAGRGSWLDTMLKGPQKNLKDISQWFLWLSKEFANQPLAVTIEQILGLRLSRNFNSPIKDFLISNGRTNVNQYFHGLSAIQLIRALVHEFSADSEPTLSDFVRFVEINQQNGVVVADESPFVTGSHAVQLLTIHKAKGLEFDDVYIIDATDDNWRPKLGNRKPPANLPLQPPLDDFDDYVRLMYVAATRAKSSLTISAYYQNHSGKDVAESAIVRAAMSIEKIDENDPQLLIEVLEENLRWPQLRGGEEKQMLQARLEGYTLYATHLLNFLDVSRGGPQHFKERNLLYLPELKTPSLSYGSAMHVALEFAQSLVNKNKFDLNEIEKSFDEALRREHQLKHDYERYLQQGKNTLRRLFSEFGYKLATGSLTEQEMNGIRLGDARIGGTIDRIDKSNGSLAIIDYKTGSPLGNFDTRDKSKAVRAYRHKLQLIFYALLASEHSNLAPEKITSRIVYVEADNINGLERTYTPTPDDIAHMRRLIQAIWYRIMNLELPDISGYSQDIDGIRAFEKYLIESVPGDGI